MESTVSIILVYFILPIVIIFGVMFLIRRKRDQAAGRPPSNKVKSIKEEESNH